MFGGRKAARRFSLLLLEVGPVLVKKQAAWPLGAETYTLGFRSSLGALQVLWLNRRSTYSKSGPCTEVLVAAATLGSLLCNLHVSTLEPHPCTRGLAVAARPLLPRELLLQ